MQNPSMPELLASGPVGEFIGILAGPNLRRCKAALMLLFSVLKKRLGLRRGSRRTDRFLSSCDLSNR